MNMFYHNLLILLLLSLTCECHYDRARIIEGAAKIRKLPQLDICGLFSTVFGTRIINGRPARLGAYPWMVLLIYRNSSDGTTILGCAGSLVTNQHVVTAAHCLEHTEIIPRFNLHEVRLGDMDNDEDVDDGASPLFVGIETTIMHQHYDDVTRLNDIGIIKMKEKVQFTDLIRPICLPPPEFKTNMFVTFTPVVAGWGISRNNSEHITDTRLLEAELTIQDLDECRANLTSKMPEVLIDNSVVCAYSPFSDTCRGDSGGPLMFPRKLSSAPDNSPGNMFLMGIVSYGYSCAQPGFPGVYTRVSHHMAWLIEHLDI